ncbi:TPA: DUF1642 domain-containing protein [Listeria innocua]|nr:DUF1642 domain-containing protein [Listeria monocytogenes]
MRFREGDRVELILRSKKRVGTVEEVYNDTQKCKVQIDGFPVTVTKLQKYLVKAEEPELVVVPQFVADWIEQREAKGDDLYTAMDKSWQSMNYKVIDWLEEGEDRYNKISLYSKKLYTEEELKKIVLTTFNANKQELIFIQDGKKFIDSASLCEIVAENNSEITSEYPFREVLFSRLKVSEVAE